MNTTPIKLWRRQGKTTSQIGLRGKIILWSRIRIPSKAFVSQAPYPVVVIQISQNKKMIGQLVDWDQNHLRKGQEVVAVLRKNTTIDKEGVIPYVIKFRPV